MKRVHVLRYDGEPAALSTLVDALRADGARAGWLDLTLSDPVPASLAAPAALDVLRAVAVGERLAIAVKPMHGAPVLRDLLREHFRGCRVVVVKGEVEAPRLTSSGDGWVVAGCGYSDAELAAALRRPRPFGGPSLAS